MSRAMRRWGLRAVVGSLSLLALLPATTSLASPRPSGAEARKQGASARLAQAASWERIHLPDASRVSGIEVDALGARIVVDAKGPLAPLSAALEARRGSLCPESAVEGGRVVLRCRSRRIDAALVRSRGASFLDLREVRGLPPDPAPPRVFWDPVPLGLGGACPGDSPFSQGECALAAGRDEEASSRFREALEDPSAAGAASIRLGDLAAAKGALAEAGEHYRRPGAIGIWGRIGVARSCELLGSCLGSPDEDRIFDPVGLPEPLRSEVALRGARAFAFEDRLEAAARLLESDERACALDRGLCRRIAVEAMRTANADARTAGLLLFLALPDRTSGALAFELATAAAEVAAEAGAPRFGASSLAVVADAAPRSLLGAHLLRTAQLYLQAGDRVRASVILEFADERLGKKVLASRPWAQVRASVESAEASPETPPPPEKPDLEAARQALERAKEIETGT
ncbi:hypothetical protein [Vulgatibacter incomptus]|uniref:Uncharacterized protein n=1 Tax=Vulgatibacter incomptus TaxID=1391653 RepID=A0A0K1PHP6_9BACT|nr:hypothetical protein [Vulgatibacter incomptus]AKU93032.1 hypothetical protein AKJ08_3419 [Vulgatibacter incomptus]